MAQDRPLYVPNSPLGTVHFGSYSSFFIPFDQESDDFLTCKKYPKWRGTDFQQSGKSNRSQQSAMSSVSHLSTSSKNSIWPDEYKGIKDTWCVMRFEYFSFMNLIQFLVLITGKFCMTQRGFSLESK